MADESTVPTPGFQTSEFWMGMISQFAGVGLIVYGAIKGDTAIIGIGASLAGLPSVGYSVGRGIAKSGK
jgi:hypothetical protein